jgi:polyhydroxyalkanoate synthesis repressor PhaR
MANEAIIDTRNQGRQPRIIKKYPNRRLYDTAISSYITLEDVRHLVLEQKSFCVRDARTDQDITRSILLQIIIEQEERHEPIFSTDTLQQLIHFYGDTLQGMVSAYLEKSFKIFVRQQQMLREQMHSVVRRDPIAFMRELAEQNISLWKEVQEGFFMAQMPSRQGRTLRSKDGGLPSEKSEP